MYEDFFAVIMAGGRGTRLWPLSRKGHPKQSIKINGEDSLFQIAVKRLLDLIPYERLIVITVADQVEDLHRQCPEIPQENFVTEPLGRGTASVVGLAAIAIRSRVSCGTMAILPADHLIENSTKLRELLKAAYQVAQDDYLVTLGITPTFPATGYGYVQKGEALCKFEGMQTFKVSSFKEKPDPQQAEIFSTDGKHTWNSGMFIWKANTVLEEFEKQMPGLYQKLMTIERAWSGDQKEQVLMDVWPTIEPQTIDYGIMEGAEKVAVIPARELGWSDVGSWDSLFDALQKDQDGNIILKGETVTFDTQGTLICEDSADRMIVTIGIKDLVIIDSGKSILVCDRKDSQNVREVIEYLKQEGREQYL
jgi:mannose-1-phosphate guanylyltransferase